MSQPLSPSRPTVSWDAYSLKVNGERLVLRAGALHYFRLPSQDLWRHRLGLLKAAGYNAVDLYFCWSYHSHAQGHYDFTGAKDVEALLALATELGLWVIVRPGPYINAETSGGGLPGWVLADPAITALRNQTDGRHTPCPAYMAAVREWWEALIPRLATCPNVLLLQLENEYVTDELDPTYINTLGKWAVELGLAGVPTFHNDMLAMGCFEGNVDLYAFDHYAVMAADQPWRTQPQHSLSLVDHVEASLRPFCQNRPLFVAELQAGWFSGWRGPSYQALRDNLMPELTPLLLKSLLGQGLTMFNHFMAVGGTNHGYLASTDGFTSYDFAAPVSETGVLQPHYFAHQRINQQLASFACLAATQRQPHKASPLVLPPEAQTHLYAVRQCVETEGTQWVFCRNLKETSVSFEATFTHEGETYPLPITLAPLAVTLLPTRLALASGHTLLATSAEPLAQGEGWLALQGEAGTTLILQNPQGEVVTLTYPAVVGDTETVHTHDGLIIKLLPPLLHSFLPSPSGRGQGEGLSSLSPRERAGVREPQELPPLAFIPLGDEAYDLDSLGWYEGTAVYQATWPAGSPRPASVAFTCRHLWGAALHVGDAPAQWVAGNASWPNNPHNHAPTIGQVALPASTTEPLTLTLLIDFLGHPKGFYNDARTPGGLLSMDWQGSPPATWQATSLGNVHDPTLCLNASALWPQAQVWETTFDVSPKAYEASLSCALCVDVPLELAERINLLLNGQLVARVWEAHTAQTRFVLPAGCLQVGSNTLHWCALGLSKPLQANLPTNPAWQQVKLVWAEGNV